jgi:hypothetical protein
MPNLIRLIDKIFGSLVYKYLYSILHIGIFISEETSRTEPVIFYSVAGAVQTDGPHHCHPLACPAHLMYKRRRLYSVRSSELRRVIWT